MRDETRERLDRHLKLRRLKFAASGAAVAGALAALLWFSGLDASVENRVVSGTITRVGPAAGYGSVAVETGLAVDLRLDDGRDAHVLALKASKPEVGQHVAIAEHVHGTGRSTFSWR